MKQAGELDFKVSKLEALWEDDPRSIPMAEWRWRLMIRVPEELTAEHVRQACKVTREKKGQDVPEVKRTRWKEGRCLQVMHVGPYDKIESAYQKLSLRAEELGLTPSGRGHEIYISDPRRTAPDKLKTIVRLPVKTRR